MDSIWLIFGGQTAEHDISLSSAKVVASRLNHKDREVIPACIRRTGQWAVDLSPIPRDATAETISARFDDLDAADTGGFDLVNAGAALARAQAENAAAMLPILHGPFGEDGTIQGFFEIAGISYVGAGVLASALAMDKPRCQAMLGGSGFPVPSFVTGNTASHGAAEIAARVREEMEVPCVIKPARCGSSVGITIVREESALEPAIETAAKYDSLIMAEDFVEGREATCGVLERRNSNGVIEIRTLPVTLIEPVGREFYDIQAKYEEGGSKHTCPAPFDETTSKAIQAWSREAFQLLGCRDMARVDFIVSKDQGPMLLEVNTIPGMTPTSLLPEAAAVDGISFEDLLEGMIQNALSRSNRNA